MPTRLEPEVPAAAERATAGLFGGLSHLRQARIFHPRGLAFRGHLAPAPDSVPTGVPFLDDPGHHDVVVRFSKGAGLPDPLPDVLGIAVRVLDADGPGRHRDLLFATSGAAPLLRHLLLPAVRLGGRAFSAVLPYRCGERFWMLAASCPAGAPSLAALRRGAAPPPVTLHAATPLGAWRPFARVELAGRLTQDESAALAFDPWNAGDDLRPAGFLNALRHPAYRASRAARPRDDSRGERP